jgi:Holliday junction DNA helicase RuvB
MVDEASLVEIAKRARGTPRIALKLLKRARDMSQVKGKGNITKELTAEALALLEIDTRGLDNSDIRFLKAIIDMHQGGPVGVETLAAKMWGQLKK